MENQLKDALGDFRTFLCLTWKHLRLPAPTPLQLDIAHFLQHGGNRIMIQAFRGVGKSYITVAYVMWRLLLEPDLKIKTVSATSSFAQTLAHFCYKLLDMDIMECRRPTAKQRSSSIMFDVNGSKSSKDPSLTAVGIFGQITGHRADVVISDDIEVANNSETQGKREKLRMVQGEFGNILKPGGKIIYLGTPQTEESIYRRLPEMGYSVKIWPFEVPSDLAPYDGKFTPFMAELCSKQEPGSLVEPTRFSEEDRLIKVMQNGRAGYQLQFMLNTELSDYERYPLRFNDLIVMPVDSTNAPEKLVWAQDKDLQIPDLPNVGFDKEYFHKPWQVIGEWIPFQGSVMSIDVAGRGGHDETSYAVVKQLNGYLYVVDCGGLTTGYSNTTWETLAAIAAKHKVNTIVFETNYGDGVHLQLFKPILSKVHPCTIEEIKHTKQKELRIIDTLEPVMASHKLVIDQDLIKKDYHSCTSMYSDRNATSYMLMYQMSRITRDKGSLTHDDRLDALAMAVAYWTKYLSVDVERQMSKRQDQFLRDFMKDFWVINEPSRKYKTWLDS